MRYKNYQVTVVNEHGEEWVYLYDRELDITFSREIAEDIHIDELGTIIRGLEQEADYYRSKPVELKPDIPF